MIGLQQRLVKSPEPSLHRAFSCEAVQPVLHSLPFRVRR